jgi:hypothetical protein
VLLSCTNQTVNESTAIELNEIDLPTTQDRKKFLLQILEDDQTVRDGNVESSLITSYGYNSEEHMEFINEQWEQDEINLQKVELYLKKYGYPKKDLFGKDATIAPWLVIHHSTNTAVRNRHFDILYKAYQDGNIDQTAFLMYLNRTYKFTFREDFNMEGSYSAELEISRLIEALAVKKEMVNN